MFIGVLKHKEVLKTSKLLKTSTKWWADGKVSDSEFLAQIQYLINQKILTIEAENTGQKTPSLDVSIHGQKVVRRGTAQNLGIHVENSDGKKYRFNSRQFH